MPAATLDQALDIVMQLPAEQQEMLLDILHRRLVEARRQEIARDAQESLADYSAGQLNPQSAAEGIAELHNSAFPSTCPSRPPN
jgi:hypothetical protein